MVTKNPKSYGREITQDELMMPVKDFSALHCCGRDIILYNMQCSFLFNLYLSKFLKDLFEFSL